MTTKIRCTICANPFVRATVDRLLDDKMTFAGISRYSAEAGITLDPEVISRHAKHYAPPPERPKGSSKRDFAIVIRDKALKMIDDGSLALDHKDLVPGINAGLKAQAILDQREKAKSKQQSAELAFAIIQMLGGQGAQTLRLDDGMTIEGEYEVADGEAE